jgi:NTE family protein
MKYLVLGPGGMGFYSLVGALTNVDLTIVEEVSGSSAGSLLGLFVAMEWTVQEIVDVVMTINPYEELNGNIWNIFSNWGLFEHDAVKKILYKIFEKKILFKNLKKKLWISSYNATLCKTEYFSGDTHPDMSVFDAICMSISIPIIFKPFIMNEWYYIDGAVGEYLPMYPFALKPLDDILVVNIDLTEQSIGKPKDFVEFLSRISKIFLLNKKSRVDCKFINIPVNEDVFNFNLSIDTKNKLYLMGVKAIKAKKY